MNDETITNNPDKEPDIGVDLPEQDNIEEVSVTVANVQDLQFADLLKLQQQLVNDFEIKLKYDAAKQEQIDKLYSENQEYKEGILEKFRRQFILAVIEQVDESDKSIRFFDEQEYSEDNYRKLLVIFGEIADDFRNMLFERFGIVSYRCEPLSSFDVNRQRPLRTTPTDDESLHRQVKQSLKPGYEQVEGGVILRHEMVDVYTKNN